MQAKISVGNDCLRFPWVTGPNLPAFSGNLCEAFIVRVRADFLKPWDVSFYPVPNTLTEVTTCCLWSQWQTLQIWFCSKKVGLFIVGSSVRYPKKYISMKNFSLSSKWSRTGCCQFWLPSHFLSERLMSSKSKKWSWMVLETQCVLNQMEQYCIFKNHWIIIEGKNAL